MELSFLKRMVLTFLGSQGATQGPKDRKSKFSVPRPPPPPPRLIGPFPKGACLGSSAGVMNKPWPNSDPTEGSTHVTLRGLMRLGS